MNILKALLLVGVLTVFAACGKDACKEIVCQNGGECMDGDCACPPEFEGNLCEYVAIGDYLGTYSILYNGCFQASPDHKVTVAEVAGARETIMLGGLGDYACPGGELEVQATVGINSLTITSQTICQNGNFKGYTFTGQGTRQGDTLNLSFLVTYEADGVPLQDNCTATMIKE